MIRRLEAPKSQNLEKINKNYIFKKHFKRLMSKTTNHNKYQSRDS
jgi:hypothetical protein